MLPAGVGAETLAGARTLTGEGTEGRELTGAAAGTGFRTTPGTVGGMPSSVFLLSLAEGAGHFVKKFSARFFCGLTPTVEPGGAATPDPGRTELGGAPESNTLLALPF